MTGVLMIFGAALAGGFLGTGAMAGLLGLVFRKRQPRGPWRPVPGKTRCLDCGGVLGADLKCSRCGRPFNAAA